MVATLYIAEASAPCRSVLLTAEEIGMTLNIKTINLALGEHLTPEFIKINPQHTVPTLVDDDVVIGESHAICSYLARKYGKNDNLYPSDPAKRATVDKFLHYDGGVLFNLTKDIAMHIYMKGVSQKPEEKFQQVREQYKILDICLQGKHFITGQHITIADLCLIATVTSVQFFVNIDETNYPHLAKWIERCMKLSCYKANSGVQTFYNVFKQIM